MGQTCEERAETCKAENTRHRGVMLVERKTKVMDVGHRVVRDELGGEGGKSCWRLAERRDMQGNR